MNLTQLRAAQPSTLFAAAERFKGLSASLDARVDELRTDVRQVLQKSWRGRAGDSALAAVDALIERHVSAAARMTEVGKAVWRFGDVLETAQEAVGQVDQAAAQNGLEVGEDGVQLAGDKMFQADWVAFAQDLNRNLASGLQAATQADAECAAVFGLPAAQSDAGGDEDGSIWGDIVNGLGWASNASTVLGAVGGLLPGAKIPSALPFGGAITLGTGAQTIVNEVGNFIDPDERRDGWGGVAQVGKAGFAAAGMGMVLSSSALFPPLALGTAAVWAGANLLDRHWDTIADGWDTTTDTASTALDWGLEQGGNLIEGAGDMLESVGGFLS